MLLMGSFIPVSGDFAFAKKPVPTIERNPIVFVPGYMGRVGNWDVMAQRFIDDGYSAGELFQTDCIGHLALITDLKVYTQVRDYLAK